MRLGILMLALLGTLAVAPFARGEEGESEAPATTATPSKEEILRRNRERWERMTPDERRKALERLRRFQALSKEEKDALREKARRGLGKLSAEDRESIARRKEELRRKHGEVRRLASDVAKHLTDGIREAIRALDPKTRRGVERFIMARLFEAQYESMIESLPEETRKEMDGMTPRERHRAMRNVFRSYRESILATMPAEERERLATLPKEEQRKARHHWMKKDMDRKRVALVSEKVAPQLERLLALPPDELHREIRREMRRFEDCRRGPGPGRGPGHPGGPGEGGQGERKRRGDPEEHRRSMRRSLIESGLPEEEVDRLLALPPPEMFEELKTKHPEIHEKLRRRGPGRGPGPGPGPGPDRGPEHRDGER